MSALVVDQAGPSSKSAPGPARRIGRGSHLSGVVWRAILGDMRMVTAAALAVLACSCRTGHSDPDGQQLARINKDIALLIERVDGLAKRVDRLEGRPDSRTGSATGLPSVPANSPGPGTAAKPAGADKTVTVAVSAAGAVTVDGASMSAAELARELGKYKQAGHTVVLSIRTEASSPPATLIEIIDLARESGITDFSIAPR
ncbi:MAG: biopolymer transporter ExbD [Proteobacteria bacterium]|nr:biopolymer transporter ExbD [Pseudomonadota bacterium]